MFIPPFTPPGPTAPTLRPRCSRFSMPQKPKRRIGRVYKKHSAPRAGSAEVEAGAELPAERDSAQGAHGAEAVAEELPPSRVYAAERMSLYGRLAWLSDYTQIFKVEAAINGAAASIGSFMSSWRARRLKLGGSTAAREQERSEARVSQDYERLARERSVHHVPFSQAVKAVSWLVDQVPVADWKIERARRALPGQKWATEFLEWVSKMRPPPEFPLHKLVRFYIFDQTYAVGGRGTGAGSKHTNPVQKVDEAGDKIKKQRRVYINSFDLAVDARVCQLSRAAIDVIARRGPYTQVCVRARGEVG